MEYSARKLTYEKDRLPAIAGAARQFQDDVSQIASTGAYLAGAWSEDLFRETLWFSYDNDWVEMTRGRRPEKYRAPSWPWAAIEGPLLFVADEIEGGSIMKHVEFLKYSCTPTGPDLFGPFPGGALQVQGPLLCLNLQIHFVTRAGHGGIPPENPNYGYDLCKNQDDDESLWVSPDYLNLASEYTDHKALDNSGERVLGRVYCMLFALNSLPQDEETHTNSLVLREKGSQGDDNGNKTFERIGLAFQSYLLSKRQSQDWFFGASEGIVSII